MKRWTANLASRAHVTQRLKQRERVLLIPTQCQGIASGGRRYSSALAAQAVRQRGREQEQQHVPEVEATLNANVRPSASSPGGGGATNATASATTVSGTVSGIETQVHSQTQTKIDPYKFLAPELSKLRKTLLHLLGSSHPSLTTIAEYYFLQPSKQIRPLLVLLFARATNGLGGDWDEKRWAATEEGARGRSEELDAPLSRADVLNDWNPNMPDHTRSFESVFELPPPRALNPSPVYTPSTSSSDPSSSKIPTLTSIAPYLLPTQLRLAQIVEMIHVASLLHDDVIDSASLRRGAPSAPAAFGNKLAVLAGDFLLGRASAALSRLGSSECTELIAGVIANLVEGEILQMQKALTGGETGPLSEAGLDELELGLGLGASASSSSSPSSSSSGRIGAESSKGKGRVIGREIWNVYLRKSYLKTASLIAKSARAAVVLGGAREGEIWKEVAYAYGRNIGIAFQVRVLGLLSSSSPQFFPLSPPLLSFFLPNYPICLLS